MFLFVCFSLGEFYSNILLSYEVSGSLNSVYSSFFFIGSWNLSVKETRKKNNTLKTILENLLQGMTFGRIAAIQDKNRWVSLLFCGL